MPYSMTLTEIELTISKIVYDMFSSNHAKFHAFITKVNNSALFWTLAARLLTFSQTHRYSSNLTPGINIIAAHYS